MRRWYLRAPWKPDGKYTLTIPAGAITDIAGFTNDSIVGKYTVLAPEKHATVIVNVKARDSMRYIVQLLAKEGPRQNDSRDRQSSSGSPGGFGGRSGSMFNPMR